MGRNGLGSTSMMHDVRSITMRVIVFCCTLLVVMFVPIWSDAAAQDVPGQNNAGSRYFGAPVLKYTVIRDQGAVMFGGRGGWNISPSFLIGAGVYATMSEVNGPEGALPYATGPLDLKFETFGLDLEYACRPASPVHFTLGMFLGGGAVHFVKDKTDEQQDETDFTAVLEPSVGLEWNITDSLHLNLAASYRFVIGVDQPGLKDKDFTGPAVSFAVKIGQF